jgi:hypothetical protein
MGTAYQPFRQLLKDSVETNLTREPCGSCANERERHGLQLQRVRMIEAACDDLQQNVAARQENIRVAVFNSDAVKDETRSQCAGACDHYPTLPHAAVLLDLAAEHVTASRIERGGYTAAHAEAFIVGTDDRIRNSVSDVADGRELGYYRLPNNRVLLIRRGDIGQNAFTFGTIAVYNVLYRRIETLFPR